MCVCGTPWFDDVIHGDGHRSRKVDLLANISTFSFVIGETIYSMEEKDFDRTKLSEIVCEV